MADDDILPTPPEEGGILENVEPTLQAAANAAQNLVGQIAMVAVASSDIAAAGYDPINFRLQIQFTNGRIYLYEKVSPLEFEQFMASPSKGQYFWQVFRRDPISHPFTRLQ